MSTTKFEAEKKLQTTLPTAMLVFTALCCLASPAAAAGNVLNYHFETIIELFNGPDPLGLDGATVEVNFEVDLDTNGIYQNVFGLSTAFTTSGIANTNVVISGSTGGGDGVFGYRTADNSADLQMGYIFRQTIGELFSVNPLNAAPHIFLNDGTRATLRHAMNLPPNPPQPGDTVEEVDFLSSAPNVWELETTTTTYFVDRTEPSPVTVATTFESSEDDPILPTGGLDPNSGGWPFNGVPGDGQWFDPVAASGYLYETDGLSNFTDVGLPAGLGDADGFYTINDGINLPVAVAAGASHSFPTAVDKFTVTGIDPTVDGEDPLAFPTFLAFDQTTVSFTMTPIPEPSSILLAAGLAALVACRRNRVGRLA